GRSEQTRRQTCCCSGSKGRGILARARKKDSGPDERFGFADQHSAGRNAEGREAGSGSEIGTQSERDLSGGPQREIKGSAEKARRTTGANGRARRGSAAGGCADWLAALKVRS